MAQKDVTTRQPFRIRPAHRFSLSELLLWMIGISVALSSPYWLGASSLAVVFYGTLAALTWRLSRMMPWFLSIVIAFMVATVFAVITTLVISS